MTSRRRFLGTAAGTAAGIATLGPAALARDEHVVCYRGMLQHAKNFFGTVLRDSNPLDKYILNDTGWGVFASGPLRHSFMVRDRYDDSKEWIRLEARAEGKHVGNGHIHTYHQQAAQIADFIEDFDRNTSDEDLKKITVGYGVTRDYLPGEQWKEKIVHPKYMYFRRLPETRDCHSWDSSVDWELVWWDGEQTQHEMYVTDGVLEHLKENYWDNRSPEVKRITKQVLEAVNDPNFSLIHPREIMYSRTT